MGISPMPAHVGELRLPPHSIEAEQSLLGGLLLDNSAYDRIAERIRADDFYRDEHRRIYRTIIGLIDAKKPADVVTVWERLEAMGEAKQCGGLAYLGEIANNTPSAANIAGYARLVREKRRLRDLLSAGDRLSAMAFGATDATDSVAEAQALLNAIAEDGAGVGEPVSIIDIMGPVVTEIQNRYETGGHGTGLSTGFADIDNLLGGGMQPGDLIVIAGRPSMGKTAVALNIAEHAAMQGHGVLFESFEMRGTQLALRTLASMGRIDVGRLRSARLQDDDFPRITSGLARMSQARLWIDDKTAPNIVAIRARARRHKRKHGLDLIVIDYLQLLMGAPGANRTSNRNEELSAISRECKALARELDVPVIALSQLSRDVEKRIDKRPVMSDLRESGAIEQDADVIVMAYRDDYYNPSSEQRGTAEMIVRKNRMGEIGTARLTFNAAQSRFENFTAASQVEYSGLNMAREAEDYEFR